jgi:TetR/AcrR family transcriptional repressor of nem operon
MPWEKQFDRTEALDRAQRILWKTGYQKSSLTMLLRGMGIQRGSFYATFKSKHHVLVEALHRYIAWRFGTFEALAAKHPPLEAIRRHLDDVLAESTGDERFMGCFLVNCATELAPRDRAVRDIVDATLRAHAAFLQSLLDRAKQRGELRKNLDTEARAAALLGLVMGMRVFARGGLPAGTIRALRRQAEALLSNDA